MHLSAVAAALWTAAALAGPIQHAEPIHPLTRRDVPAQWNRAWGDLQDMLRRPRGPVTSSQRPSSARTPALVCRAATPSEEMLQGRKALLVRPCSPNSEGCNRCFSEGYSRDKGPYPRAIYTSANMDKVVSCLKAAPCKAYFRDPDPAAAECCKGKDVSAEIMFILPDAAAPSPAPKRHSLSIAPGFSS